MPTEPQDPVDQPRVDVVDMLAIGLRATYQEARDKGAAADEIWRKIAIIALRDGPRLAAEPTPANQVMVSTLQSARLSEPLVQLDFPEPIKRLQLELVAARDLATNMLNACSAAETDAFLMGFLKARLELEDGQVFGVIREFREWRDARIGGQPEQGGT